MCNDFTDMQCVNKDFMDYGYAMRNDFMDMQSVMTLRIFSVFTDMKSVNQAPYGTFLFLRI